MNKFDCLPEEEINKKLSQAFISISFIDNQINSDDYSYPISLDFKSKLLPITTSLFKNYIFEFLDIRYRSDNNLFFDGFEENKSHRLSDVKEYVDIRGSNTLIKGTFNQINFVMADEIKIISRFYEKITISFAQIGGLTHGLILIAKVILYFWSENNILIYLISRIISNEETKDFFKTENKQIENEFSKSQMVKIEKEEEKIEEDKERNNQSLNENRNNLSNAKFLKVNNSNNIIQPNSDGVKFENKEDIIQENLNIERKNKSISDNNIASKIKSTKIR